MNHSTSLRVMIAHNAYQERGGEDSVVEAEAELLSRMGHAVYIHCRHNDELNEIDYLRAAMGTIWSQRSATNVKQIIDSFEPDILHAHNTFPLISPAIYWVAAARNIPIVQTLHNFRLLCAQAMFLRDSQVCEDCLGRLPWRGVVHRCYRNSTAQSSLLVSMLAVHRIIGTYRRKVTRYIALNEFSREKFIAGGIPKEKIVVKPNFVSLDSQKISAEPRNGFLYVGRLSQEKGINTLVAAARMLKETKFTVIGTGPEDKDLKNEKHIHMLGFQSGDVVQIRMRKSFCLILPSICYENFPRTLAEAFGCGLPIIASRIGAMAVLIRDGVTGLLFEPGNAEDLTDKIRWATNNPAAMRRMGEAAQIEYQEKYTPAVNYSLLMSIYGGVINEVERGC